MIASILIYVGAVTLAAGAFMVEPVIGVLGAGALMVVLGVFEAVGSPPKDAS